MTTNSINYNKHLEDKRANLVREQLQREQNLETQRHNRAIEALTGVSNKTASESQKEAARHNVVSEGNTLYIAAADRGARLEAARIAASSAFNVASLQTQTAQRNTDVTSSASRYGSLLNYNAALTTSRERNQSNESIADKNRWSNEVIKQQDRELQRELESTRQRGQTTRTVISSGASLVESIGRSMGKQSN